jgi:hypothetical protein
MRTSFWNPFLVYAITCAFVVLIYALRYSSLYPELTLEVGVFLMLSVMSALFMSLLVMGTPLAANRPSSGGAGEWLLAGFVVAGFAAEFVHFGGVPLFQTMSGAAVDYQGFGIPTFHVGLIGVACFFSVYWWDCYLATRAPHYVPFALIGILGSLLSLSRGLVLILLLAFVFAYGNRVGLRRRILLLGSLALGAILGFGYLGEARMGSAAQNVILAMGGANEAFAASGLPDPVFWFYIYVSSPLANLQYTDLHRPSDIVQWIGVAADFLPDFVSNHLLTPEQLHEIEPILVTPELNVGTAYARPLMAMGWMGSYALHAFFLVFFYFSISFARGSKYYGALLAFLSAAGCLMFFNNMLSFAGCIGPILIGIGLVALQRFRFRRVSA